MEIRLQILKDNKIIDEQTYEDTLKVFEKIIVEKHYDKEVSTPFITHLAMAIQRVKNNEKVNALDSMILDEIQQLSQYDIILSLLHETLSLISVSLPEEEQQFLQIHLATIVQKGGKCD